MRDILDAALTQEGQRDQALGAVLLDKGRKVIRLLPAESGATGDAEAAHDAP